jgi:hypothetical protein
MPFNLQRAAGKTNHVTLKFNGEPLKVVYNAGAKFKEYEQATQRLENLYRDLAANPPRPSAEPLPRYRGLGH